MTLRTPYDGAPFYCITCGAGFYELMACERTDCDREDVTIAKGRQWAADQARKHNAACEEEIARIYGVSANEEQKR